jgi:hypothetical protein
MNAGTLVARLPDASKPLGVPFPGAEGANAGNASQILPKLTQQ